MQGAQHTALVFARVLVVRRHHVISELDFACEQSNVICEHASSHVKFCIARGCNGQFDQFKLSECDGPKDSQ